MDTADEENIEQIKNSLRSRLRQSGVNNLIRHMVRDACSSRGDTEEVQPEEIVEELYKKGLMKTVLENIEWTDNLARELEETMNGRSGRKSDMKTFLNQTMTEGFTLEQIGGNNRSSPGKTNNVLNMNPSGDYQPKNNYHYSGKEAGGGGHHFEHAVDIDEEVGDDDDDEKEEEKEEDDEEDTFLSDPFPSEREEDNQRLPPVQIGRLNGKYFLKLEVVDGKSFLEQLFCSDSETPTSRFILHISYRSQRFYTKPTLAQCNPSFREVFMIDIGYYENGNILQLLANADPIHIILLQETGEGDRRLLSSCWMDWRAQLMSERNSQKFPVTLMGIGSEFQVPVGVLGTKLSILPPLEEILSSTTYVAQINAEKSIQDEKERLFLIYVKQWWREYIEIRPQHSKRLVKVFSYDENTTPRPIQTFIKPLAADRLLLTPFHAAWFVSLFTLIGSDTDMDFPLRLPTFAVELGTPQVLCSHWQSLISTLTTRAGRVEDHATLLCSLLLGFGLDAYVAIGTKIGGTPWVWVITFESERQVTFWESTNGTRYIHQSIATSIVLEDKLARIKTAEEHSLKTISCIFNHHLFYANIQNTIFVDVTDWNLLNPSKWKKIPENMLKSSAKYTDIPPVLMPPTANPALLSADVEIQLKTLISEHRLGNNLRTTWDQSLSVLLGQELAKYELEACTGTKSLPGYFESAILKNMPGGYEFKGYPGKGNSEDASQIFRILKRNPKCEEIMLCRGSDVQLALRAQVFVYPENVISVRLMLACRFLPAG